MKWLARLAGRRLLITDIDERPDLSKFTHRVPVVRIDDRVIAEETVPVSTLWRVLI